MRTDLVIAEVATLLACAFGVALSGATRAQSTGLVREGTASCALVVESGTGDTAAYEAAMTLRCYLQRMTGAIVPITPSGGWPEGPVIFVGKHRRAVEIAGDDLCHERLGDEGFVMRTEGEHIALVGMTGRATMSAVYAFLEALGCRFYMPVPQGFVIPTCKDLQVGLLDVVSTPVFGHRRFFLSGYVYGNISRIPGFFDIWNEYEKAAGLSLRKVRIAHNFEAICPSKLFSEHPEYFPLVGGERVCEGPWDQRCLANPALGERAVALAKQFFTANPELEAFSLTPNDGARWCECPGCRALGEGPDGFTPDRLVTRWVEEVARKLRAELGFETRKVAYLAFYASSGLSVAPVGDKLPAGVIPMLVMPTCMYHAPETCELWRQGAERIAQWQAISQEPLGIYEWFDLPHWTIGVWSPQAAAIGARIEWLAAQGFRSYEGEIIGSYPSTWLAVYIAARKVWNPTLDVRALMEEYERLFFGPAAEPMGRYYMALAGALQNTGAHAVSSSPLYVAYDNNGAWPYEGWSDEQIAQMQDAIADAQKAAQGQDPFATRVSYEADCFEVQSEYLRIMRSYRAEGPSALLLERLAALTERIGKSPHPWAIGASLMQSAFIPSLRKEIQDAMAALKSDDCGPLKLRRDLETGLRLMGCAATVVGDRTVVLATGERHDTKRPCLMALTAEGDVLWRDEFAEETGAIAMGAEPHLLDLGDGRHAVAQYVAHRESGANSVFRLLEPLTGAEIWRADPGIWYGGNRDVHCLDIDGDGRREVLAGFSDRLICFEAETGATRWVNAERMAICWGRSAIGDINGDEKLEIVLGSEYANPDGTSSIMALRGADGTRLWEYTGIEGDCGSTPAYLLDVDGDGELEVLKTEIDLLRRGPVHMARLWCLEADGALKWRTDLGGGDVTIADFDGDGGLEAIAITNGRDGGDVPPAIRCICLRDGSLKWETPLGRVWLTGWSTATDTDGDGRAEAILIHGNPSGYGKADGSDPWGEVLVVDGAGTILQRIGLSDWPVSASVFDFDGDGADEVIVSCGDGKVRVFGR